MNSLNEKNAVICKKIYDYMQAGHSQNSASRIVGKPSSWASKWLPIYLRHGADLESNVLTGNTPFQREAELLLRIANDCEIAACKVDHLFRFNWQCPELLEVSGLQFQMHRSLRVIAQKLRDKRKILLKEGKKSQALL